MVNLRGHHTTSGVMAHVLIALLPGLGCMVYQYGLAYLLLVATCIFGAVVCELACTRRISDLTDNSALVTGLLIALCLPASTPWYVGLVACVVSIALAKHAFGGLGNNIFNPAMAGYAVVLVAYPSLLVEFDAVTGATALEKLAHREGLTIAEVSQDAAFDAWGAAKHEWVNLAFLVGGIYLLILRVIDWFMPAALLIGVGLMAFLLDDGGSSSSHGSPLFNWFAGGTMLAAFFVVTDPVTSPSNRLGAIVYALGIGVVTMLIRKYSSWPDGFAFAVLLANCFVPLLSRPKAVEVSERGRL